MVIGLESHIHMSHLEPSSTLAFQPCGRHVIFLYAAVAYINNKTGGALYSWYCASSVRSSGSIEHRRIQVDLRLGFR